MKAGMHSVDNILDLWHTPLLADRWASVVRICSFTSPPLGMVMDMGCTPRHGQFGLGVFELRHLGDGCIHRMVEPYESIVQTEEVRCLHWDLRAMDLAKTMGLLHMEGFEQFIARAPTRSPLSTAEVPRLTMQWIVPDDFSDASVLVMLRFHRGKAIPLDACYGFKSMFACRDSLILELDSPFAVHHYWALCTHFIPFSSRRALVHTDTSAEVWTTTMDRVMGEDSRETAVRLRWRASKHGGRPFATPSATSNALAASKRRGTTPISTCNFSTDVTIRGEMGKEDGQVLRLLMQHAIGVTGLHLQETDYTRAPKMGEYIHLATQSDSAPPGRVRVLLTSVEDVRRLYNALHGQTVQVGADRVGVVVDSDLVTGQAVPGNGLRSWA